MNAHQTSNNAPEPLKFSDRWRNPSGFQRFLLWTPVIGLQFSEAQRLRRQLRRRDPSCLALWGKDLVRTQLARTISDIARRGLGWPNDYFIPQDAFEVVIWDNFGDAFAFAELLMELEDALGIDLGEDDEEFGRLLTMSFGEVVDLLRTRIGKRGTSAPEMHGGAM